jgi:hypothetical protein
MSGAVKNATKKQTAAPNKHAPKPINLEDAWSDDSHARRKGDRIERYVPVPSRKSKIGFLLV